MYFRSGDPRYGALSNLWPCDVAYEGVVYATLEHAYQAAKFLDPLLRERIAAEPNGAAARSLARRLKAHVRSDWFQVNLSIMETLCWHKFVAHRKLAALLLSTMGQDLVEDTADAFWGRGTLSSPGANHLGRILTSIRDHW